jgi:hypothetical protein
LSDHKLDNSPAVLQRWSDHTDLPLPSDWGAFQESNTSLALKIRREDEDLYLLLSNQAGAKLRLQAIDNSLSPCKPNIEKVAEAERKGRVQALFDAKPFEPETWNMSLQLELAMLDPQLADKLRAQAGTATESDALTNAQARRAEKETNDLRVASLNQGTAQSGAQYYRLQHLQRTKSRFAS